MPTSTRHILPNHVSGGERGILPSVIISGFVKAEIVDVPMPEDEETPLAASTDDHSPPCSIVTVRVQTSKLTKRSPRGISSSPIETSSPRCHRPSMTAKNRSLRNHQGACHHHLLKRPYHQEGTNHQQPPKNRSTVLELVFSEEELRDTKGAIGLDKHKTDCH